MKKGDATDYFKDILDAIDEVKTFIDNLTYDEFIKTEKPSCRRTQHSTKITLV